MPHRRTRDTEPMDRGLYWAVQSQGQWRSISTGLSPDRHREVEAAVQSLKKGKSAGVDNIPAEPVQAGGEDVITAFTTICDKIWQTGEWPTQWTQSLVITLPVHSLQFFQNLSRFYPALAVANTGSCVGPKNKIGHPAGCRFPCWVPTEYKQAKNNMTCGMKNLEIVWSLC